MSCTSPLPSSATGRYGANGAAADRQGLCLASFGQYDDAQKAEQRTIKRRLNHGYTERAA
jgi:predicted DNA-binding WGR domain protein